MDTVSAFLLLSAGLGLGAVHAFDPDHLAAVGVVSAQDKSSKPRYWTYALRWSLGHGLALFAIAIFVLVLKLPVPERISHVAESSVAYLLIGFGFFGIYSIFKYPFRDRNEFSGDVQGAPPDGRASVMGLVHGTAGSASLFALLPITKVSSASLGLIYVLSFSAGVALAMIVLGLSASFFLKKLYGYFEPLRFVISIVLCVLSVVVGLYLLL